MIHIAVCDDDQKDLEEIDSMVRECCSQAENVYHREIFERSVELIDEIGKGKYFDIFLLDIEMPQIDGMELAARLRDYLPQAVVILLLLTRNMYINLLRYSLSGLFRNQG